MVKSFLNSEKVEYEETKHLDEEDKKHKSSFYLCDLKGADINDMEIVDYLKEELSKL
jgi:hypothetical protein